MATMADRRRINGPSTTTVLPVFSSAPSKEIHKRQPNELRKIFLKTSLTPPATGSAFLEFSTPHTLKLTASVYGPRPLPPSATFSPHARISAELKFAAFSTDGARRGYVRDQLERDLSAQLQTALARSVRTNAYPKSGIDVFVTVLDCEGVIDNRGDEDTRGLGVGAGDDVLGAMQALAGAITCASAALADASIECVDLVSAGIAAVVGDNRDIIMDPSPLDTYNLHAAALVAYMAARDELTLVWTKGDLQSSPPTPSSSPSPASEFENVIDNAVYVATLVRTVLNESVKEQPAMVLQTNHSK